MFRDATDDDLVGLRDLEREANQAALEHVFPPELYPFPDDAVLARWRLVLDDPEVAVLVHDDPLRHGLDAYAAYDDATLRHLAVHPGRWGEGLATAAIDIALHGMDRRGSTEASLWCLQDNHRARRLYEYLGWKPTDEVREAPWAPHPLETKYMRLIVQSEQWLLRSEASAAGGPAVLRIGKGNEDDEHRGRPQQCVDLRVLEGP